MTKNHSFSSKMIFLASGALVMLTGCAGTLNTASSSDYACPGMPLGVTCKTPSAVYKSTHLESALTDFDTPIGSAPVKQGESKSTAASPLNFNFASPTTKAENAGTSPRPVREPAQVARIWIAPWVDKQDNLHLAQTHYAEIKPRTWTVGKPEVAAGSSYVIPHLAFDKVKNSGDGMSADAAVKPTTGVSPVRSQAKREAEDLVAPQ